MIDDDPVFRAYRRSVLYASPKELAWCALAALVLVGLIALLR
jgi:hypothetical protein